MIPCFAYVEDEPSKEAILRIIQEVNATTNGNAIEFRDGFPEVTHGSGRLKSTAQRMLQAAKNAKTRSIIITDLDTVPSPNSLACDWELIKNCLAELPETFVFRVAVREVESWILADRQAFATYLGFSTNNIPLDTDILPDPKQFLFDLIRAKCKKKWQKEMLPERGQSIGIEYNPRICKFIREKWSVAGARKISPSLDRCIIRLQTFLQNLIAPL